MKMVHGWRMRALKRSFILLFVLSYFILITVSEAKTLKVDTLTASEDDGNLVLQRNGTGEIVFGDYSGFCKFATGTPTCSANIDLTTDISGILPIANGGTGSATQNFVDLTTAQTVAGVKTFSNQLDVNAGADIEGAVSINNTGSGNLVTITQDSNGNALTLDQNGSGFALDVQGSMTINDDIDMTGTGALKVPVGTTAQRPGTPQAGDTRRNSEESCLETYDGSEWSCLGAGGGGGSAGINFVSDASFEGGDLDPDTNSATESYEEFTADAELYSEFNEKYFRASYTGLSAADTYVRDSFGRTGFDDKQGLLSIWVKADADDFKLCVRVDDDDFGETCDTALEVNINGDDTWKKYEIPFVFGAATVEYEIYNESYTGDVDIEVDQIYIGAMPDGYLKDVAVKTAWIPYTTTLTNISATSDFKYSQDGDTIHIRGNIGATGSATGTIFFTLPSGLNLDSSKLPLGVIGTDAFQIVGKAEARDSSPVNIYHGAVIRNNTSTNEFYIISSGDSGTNLTWNATNPYTHASGDQIVVDFSVPIQGWQPTSGAIVAQPSNQANIVVEGRGNGGGALTADVTDIDWVETRDELGLWDGTTFTAPSDGDYEVKGLVRASASTTAGIRAYINGTSDKFVGVMQASNTVITIGGVISLLEGQELTFRPNVGFTLDNNTQLHHITITKKTIGDTIAGNFKQIESVDTTLTAATENELTSRHASNGNESHSNYNWITSTSQLNTGEYRIVYSGLGLSEPPSINVTPITPCTRVFIQAQSNSQVDITTRNGSGTNTNCEFQVHLSKQGADVNKDVKGAIVGASDLSTVCQTKFLNSDVTANGDMSDVQFNNLEIGRAYQISGGFSFRAETADSLGVNFWSGPGATGTRYGNTNAGFAANFGSGTAQRPGINTYFAAQSTSLYFNAVSIATNNEISGTGNAIGSYVTLCELPDNTILNSNKFD